jgi:hypothetical protein
VNTPCAAHPEPRSNRINSRKTPKPTPESAMTVPPPFRFRDPGAPP